MWKRGAIRRKGRRKRKRREEEEGVKMTKSASEEEECCSLSLSAADQPTVIFPLQPSPPLLAGKIVHHVGNPSSQGGKTGKSLI